MTLGDGLPCKKCGTVDWYKNGNCKACNAAYRKVNKKKIEERKKAWRKSNKEKIADYHKAWLKSNKEKMVKHHAAYYKANKEKYDSWRKSNKEKIAGYEATYGKSTNGKAVRRAAQHRRRTRKTKAGGSFSAGEFKELCRHYDRRCLRCGKQFKISELTADHVVAVANGGSSDIENIQPLCRSCNSSKGANNTDYRKEVEWKYGKPVFWWQDGLKL